MCVCEREREICGHKDNQKESHSNSAEGRDPFHTTIIKLPEKEKEVCVSERERERYVHKDNQKESHSKSAEGRDRFHTNIIKLPEKERA